MKCGEKVQNFWFIQSDGFVPLRDGAQFVLVIFAFPLCVRGWFSVGEISPHMTHQHMQKPSFWAPVCRYLRWTKRLVHREHRSSYFQKTKDKLKTNNNQRQHEPLKDKTWVTPPQSWRDARTQKLQKQTAHRTPEEKNTGRHWKTKTREEQEHINRPENHMDAGQGSTRLQKQQDTSAETSQCIDRWLDKDKGGAVDLDRHRQGQQGGTGENH